MILSDQYASYKSFMRTTFQIIIISILFAGCKVDNRDDIDRMLDNTRENLKQEGKRFNAENRQWDSIINNIYEISKRDKKLAYQKVDLLILNNPQLDEFKIQDLHFAKGDLLYKNDSLDEAVKEFTKSGINFPTSLTARARAYLKLKQYKECLKDLNKAAEINSDFYWNIGNYYEVVNKKDSALFFYKKLFAHDSVIYRYCGDRIKQLADKKTKPLTELKLEDYKKFTIVMPE